MILSFAITTSLLGLKFGGAKPAGPTRQIETLPRTGSDKILSAGASGSG